MARLIITLLIAVAATDAGQVKAPRIETTVEWAATS